MTADPKPERRVRDPEQLRALHIAWRGDCALDGLTNVRCTTRRYSLHHIHRHPRDDVEANLVMLCGDGTTGHHGLIENGDAATRAALGLHLATNRADTIEYLDGKLGGLEKALEWLRRYLYAPV